MIDVTGQLFFLTPTSHSDGCPGSASDVALTVQYWSSETSTISSTISYSNLISVD
jgi:hypothetical protein